MWRCEPAVFVTIDSMDRQRRRAPKTRGRLAPARPAPRCWTKPAGTRGALDPKGHAGLLRAHISRSRRLLEPRDDGVGVLRKLGWLQLAQRLYCKRANAKIVVLEPRSDGAGMLCERRRLKLA